MIPFNDEKPTAGTGDSPFSSRPERAFLELTRRDRGAAGEVLARAFRDSPLNRAVIGGGDARRLRCNRYGMHALLQSAEGSARILGALPRSVEESPRAVLLATEPGGYPLPAPSWGQQLRCLLGQGLAVASRWGEVYRALEAVHPRESHWYLSVLGVDPSQQGQGIGSRLLAYWLQGVDRDGGFAYLETDRSENRPFYERAGFVVINEITVFGVTVWCMARSCRNAENPAKPG